MQDGKPVLDFYLDDASYNGVRVATTYCKKTKPLCGQCPLQGLNL